LVAVLDFALVVCATSVSAQPPQKGGPPTGPPPAPVVVAELVEKELAAGKMFVGTVQPRFQATIGAAIAGRVIDVMVEEGDRVKEGQELVQLLTDTIKLELATAKAELSLREHELLELENGARPEELTQAKANVLAADARVKYERRRRDRLQRLKEDQAVSEEELDEAVNAAIAAEQAYLESMATLDLTKAGPRAEKIAQAKARTEMQQAVVHRLEDQISRHTILSRFDGYVTRKHVERGQWINQGAAAIDLVALSEVDVVVSVAEEHVPFVKIGGKIPVLVTSAPDQVYEGTVVAIVPQADERARTFPVKIRIKNSESENGPVLKAGMLARVNLPTSRIQTCLLAPKDSIVLGGPTPIVYVVRQDDPQSPAQVFPSPIQLGTAHGGLIEIRAELKPGDQVVVKGNERLRPGQAVQIVPGKQVTRTADAERTESASTSSLSAP
jgi:RND family efflux transporter MFP subunit